MGDNELKTFILRVYGIVQGVGFRPTVSRHAMRSKVRGTVCNKGPYVEIFAQGSKSECESFIKLIRNDPPKMASILKIDVREICEEETVLIYEDFSIIESEKTGGEIYISPDIAVCDECKAELFDKKDHRYMHPFINCTNCGPRMTILEGLPYDRERTSMKEFPMCKRCKREYTDPNTRRYDAQPVCCNDCGPKVYILTGDGKTLNGHEAITHVRGIIAKGGIAAVKGIGGFHLCCDAKNDEAVRRLRDKKHRLFKPFAVMMKDIDSVKRECVVTKAAEEILTGHQKPIILLEKKYECLKPLPLGAEGKGGKISAHHDIEIGTDNENESALKAGESRISEAVAPENPKLGVMLPYAPIHLLLFDHDDDIEMTDCLVMTSGNDSGAPICRDDKDALDELSGLCDVILSHDRLIRVRADDTVMDMYGEKPYIIRRSRGYAPLPVFVESIAAMPGVSVIGMGGELKNTFCIGRGKLFYPSPYIGDLGDIRTLAALNETIDRFLSLLEARQPSAIACDMHPGYISREAAYALKEKLDGDIKLFEIQHHYAHILSCMAENAKEEPVIGISFDGTGYGTDKTIWGGEIMLASWDGFERAGHISKFIQAGGDISAKEGWRIAASMLNSEFGGEARGYSEKLNLCSADEFSIIAGMSERMINSVYSTSAGRLFDAVSAVLGIRKTSNYEGDASTALMYEAMKADKAAFRDELKKRNPGSLSCFDIDTVINTKEGLILNTEKLFRAIVSERLKGKDTDELALKFHIGLSEMIIDAAIELSESRKINTAALSGGVFQNLLLADMVKTGLESRGIKVLTHSLIPPNDGGIALGQAVYAMKHL